MSKTIPKEIREQVLSRVKEGKEKVSVIAEQHGISDRTIYGWLSKGIDGRRRDWLANNKLRKENLQLKQMIGELMLEKKKTEKAQMTRQQKINKSKLAKQLGISRSLIYYKHKRPQLDLDTKALIEEVLKVHKDYGHRRIAMELKLNHKRINRVMKKFGIKPYRRKAKHRIKKDDLNKPPAQFNNLIQDLTINHPNQVWCTDFTYLRYQSKFIYLATILDRYTREIVGFSLSKYHNRFLVISALLEALDSGVKPDIVHSDQGSEYSSGDFVDLVKNSGINLSMSHKGSPWENGHQESWYGKFKAEFGSFNRFDTMGELIAEIYHQIHYYNYSRIHRSLRTTPYQFKVNCLLNKTTE